MHRIVTFSLVLMACAAAPAAAATYSGSAPAAAIVWISDGGKLAPLGDAQMRQTKKKFVPDVLVVTQGTPVRFPNDDEFYHNVFSDGDSTPFDLGLYDVGPGKTVTFDRAGIANVRCHVHVSMHATIVVVDGPFARLENAGPYTLRDVRPGRHTLHVWTADGGERRSTVSVAL